MSNYIFHKYNLRKPVSIFNKPNDANVSQIGVWESSFIRKIGLYQNSAPLSLSIRPCAYHFSFNGIIQ